MDEWSERIRRILTERTRLEIAVDSEDPPLIRAAVLIPLYKIGDQIHVLLTRRTDKMDHHKGQISFPGGRYDDTDSDYLDTALREAYEEVGLERKDIEILGAMDDMLTTTGFVVTPYVGVIPHPYSLKLNEHEVAATLQVPLALFMDSRQLREEIWERQGRKTPVYFYRYNEEVIWGATARMIKSFIELIEGDTLSPAPQVAPQGRDRYIVRSGHQLHYLEWGTPSRPPLVLLHGSWQTAHSWDDFAQVMQERYHIFALDQRGHGDSDWTEHYALDDYVHDLEVAIDTWSMAPIILIGMSMGGLNALVYTARHPERVAALVLIDVGPALQGEGVRRIREFIRSAPETFASLDEAVDVARLYNPRRSRENLWKRLAHNMKQQPDGQWTWKYDRRFKIQGSAYSEGPADFWAYWRRIACPTLVVRGQESSVLSEDLVRQMVEQLPGTVVAAVAGAGHSVVGDNPTGFLAALEPFLASL